MAKLTGKVVLVTGGGSGIGAACAKLLLQEGAKVAIAGRTQSKLDDIVKTLGNPANLAAFAADVSDQKQVTALIVNVAKKFGGPIDILVNNAGTNIKGRAFRELTPEAWNNLIRTNLDSAFYCIHAVMPAMIERKDGVIINIVSVAGKRAIPLGGVAYAASKFGMAALGVGLGAEEKDHGIRVCNIYPGEVDTPIMQFRPAPVTESHRLSMLQPDDVAEAVRYVATQPKHVSIPELVIKPVTQMYV
jgi:NADP-dependent 3-hydroxy acid dehydrogenase YdfG